MAGYSTSYSHRCSTLRLFLFCMLPVMLLWGCGSGTSEQEPSEKVTTASTDTGSASFAVQWHTASAVQASAVARQAIEDCETAGVGSITCQVYGDESQSPIAGGGPWNCSDHQGTIAQIPAGSNRVFAVLGWSDADGGGNAIYQGQIGNITIAAGQITDAGTVDANPFVPAAPIIGDEFGNQINLSWNDLGVYGYRIYRDGVSVHDTTATTYSDTGLSPETQYCYTISALDSFGNESGHSGQTCATTTALSIWYRDADGDTYGNPDDSTQATSPPDGYVADNTDCNDGNHAVHPGAPELLDGLDNDCDGAIDEGFSTYYRDADSDTYGDPEDSIQATSPPDGYVADNTDCNDGNGSIHPGANEICNGIDDDCDGSTDEGVQTTYYRDADSDTYGDPSRTTQACSVPSGYVTNDDDCNDGNGSIHPGANEICNGIDDDCDGSTDEGVQTTYYLDYDGDTYGDASNTTQACSVPDGYVTNSSDCDDQDYYINPGEDEICFDAIDNNCAGGIDEDCVTANEDCIDIVPEKVYVYRPSDLLWMLVESGGNMQPLVFDDGEEAQQALDTIQYYMMDGQCFIGPRDDPSMEYWLVEGTSPMGAFISDYYTEDCLPHDPEALYIRRQGNQWLLTDGTEAIKTFPNFEEAQQALETIQYYGFTYHCYVGRPDPPMSYWRR